MGEPYKNGTKYYNEPITCEPYQNGTNNEDEPIISAPWKMKPIIKISECEPKTYEPEAILKWAYNILNHINKPKWHNEQK